MISASEFLTQIDGCNLHVNARGAGPVEGFNPLKWIGIIADIREAVVALQEAWTNPAVQTAVKALYAAFLKIVAAVGWDVSPTPTPEPAPNGVV